MISLVLLGFGGPEKPDDVAPFLANVAGRMLPPERVTASQRKYSLIGGSSPFCATARVEGRLLEDALRAADLDITVYLGMRFWKPDVQEAVDAALADSPEEVILACLTPYYSAASAGEYLDRAMDALRADENTARVVRVESWNEEPALINGYAAALREAVTAAPERTPVIFTAHSLPQDVVSGGDPYAGQVKTTAELTAKAAGVEDWSLGWQSEGHGRGEWLKPTAEDLIKEIADAGGRSVLIMPVGFTSDHMETLYDIDIVMREYAAGLNLEFYRARCLNENGAVTAAMTAAILRAHNLEGG
jgi:protoporphyrin/coproporphyrin ferrochelatase